MTTSIRLLGKYFEKQYSEIAVLKRQDKKKFDAHSGMTQYFSINTYVVGMHSMFYGELTKVSFYHNQMPSISSLQFMEKHTQLETAIM